MGGSATDPRRTSVVSASGRGHDALGDRVAGGCGRRTLDAVVRRHRTDGSLDHGRKSRPVINRGTNPDPIVVGLKSSPAAPSIEGDGLHGHVGFERPSHLWVSA